MPVRGKPFIDYQLAWLASQSVCDVVLSVGYGGAMICDHVGEGTRYGLAVTYVDEGSDLRGTGGALRLALEMDALAESFMVLYGDSYLSIELAPVWHAFHSSTLPALMTVLRNDGRWDASNVIYEQGRVKLYDKQPDAEQREAMAWIDSGCRWSPDASWQSEFLPARSSILQTSIETSASRAS